MPRGRSRARARVAAVLGVAMLLGLVTLASPALHRGSAPRAEAAPKHGPNKGKHGRLRTLPNIVLVVSDDQTFEQFRADTMPFLTDFIADDGTTFTDAIATSPVCCPSRASMLTGQYAHNHGVLSNRLGYKALKRKRNTLPVWLTRKGYVTAHVGKYLNGYDGFIKHRDEVAPGWRQWHTVLVPRYYDYAFSTNGRVVHKGSDPDDYLGRVVTRKAVKMVNKYVPRRRPLYLQTDYYAPHTEGGAPGTACEDSARPDPADAHLFADAPLPQPPSFNEADVDDKPTFVRRLAPISADEFSRTERRYRCALASLRSVDRGIEEITDAISAHGELGKTAVIFVSDNGYFYGEHRLPKEKQQAYEEGIRVPLVARWPEKLGTPRTTITLPVANIDLAPTILDLAHAKPCSSHKRCRTMDGRSLLPLVRGKFSKFPSDRALSLEYDLDRESTTRGSTCAFDGVRTPIDLYVAHKSVVSDPAEGLCEKTNETEQYLLTPDPVYGPVAADPFELRNLTSPVISDSSLPQVIARRAELEALLNRLRDCAGIAGRDPVPKSGHYCQ
jgi:N-acetylglucosamine-6-sulfatase